MTEQEKLAADAEKQYQDSMARMGQMTSGAIQWELGNAQQRWGYLQKGLNDSGWNPGGGGQFQQAADNFRKQSAAEGLKSVEAASAAKGRVFSGMADRAVAANEANATMQAMQYKLAALQGYGQNTAQGSTGGQLSNGAWGAYASWNNLLGGA
jgi:hypothetical protein